MGVDAEIPSRPVVVPVVPTIGGYGQHFTRSAVPGTVPPARADKLYFMLGQQQGLTLPNIALHNAAPHQAYRGLAPIPMSDRMNC